jgi:hypothetical protein
MRRRRSIAVVLAVFSLLLSGGLTASAASPPKWTIQPTSAGSGLAGVACSSPTACTAVGGSVVQRWDGSRWTIQPTPNPADATSTSFSGVDCLSSTDCIAVGDYVDPAGTSTLAEHWSGSRWTIQQTPTPAGPGGSVGSFLAKVACRSTNTCTAVGSATYRSGFEVSLAERWNGSRWAIQHTPNPAGSQTNLNGVACPSKSTCTAVGATFNRAYVWVLLAETWNAGRWMIQPVPNPAGDRAGGILVDVVCPSPNDCTAVGYYVNSAGGQFALVEHWNGSHWTIQPTPSPAGGVRGSGLSGVACSSPTVCIAVGSYVNSGGGELTLAERWNGSHWTIEPTPALADASFVNLNGVACPSLTRCTAVGSYFNGSDQLETLIESRTG